MTVQVSDLDLDRLMRYLKGTAILPAEERWLQEEPEILEGLRRLGLAVFPELLLEHSCSTCAAALPNYVHLELMGADAEAAHPHVKAHLDTCTRCSEAHEELYQMVVTAYTDELPRPTFYPDFDLSFLVEDERSAPFWLRRWEDVASAGRRVHSLVAEVTISLAAPFACLSASLRPALVAIPAPAQRGAEGDETIEVLDLKYPPANLLIRIGRGPVAAQSTALVIDVLQTEPSEDVHPRPLPATRIALYDEEHRLMERIGTDTAGSVRFEDLRTGHYFIQIHHAEDIWEFPLRIDGRGS